MEVPDSIAYGGMFKGGTAASIFVPGAAISGCRESG